VVLRGQCDFLVGFVGGTLTDNVTFTAVEQDNSLPSLFLAWFSSDS